MSQELLILSKEMLRSSLWCAYQVFDHLPQWESWNKGFERAKGLIEGLLREKGIGYDYSAIYVLHSCFGLKAAVFALQLFVDNVVDGMNIVWQSPKPILLATGEMNIPYDWAYAENLNTEPAEVASSSSVASSRSDPSSSMSRSGFRKWSKNLENDIDKAIPLPNVTSTVLAMAIEYCKKHAGPEPEDYVAKDALKEWDAKFANVDQMVMFDLLLAANYMDIKGLLDLFCQSAASMIKDKTVKEIRQIFNIENNFMEEEECALRDEHKWAFE
ncbi:hypothetical protein Droror1_Dr00023444 [Drosera rotundifolia]